MHALHPRRMLRPPLAADAVRARVVPPPEPIQLAGHSGARLVLFERDGGSIVRKSAGMPDQGDRLRRQSDKQRQLGGLGLPLPRVLMDGVDRDGCAFFEMDYVPARTVAAMIGDAAPFDAAPLVAALERMLGLFRLTAGVPHPVAPFHEKIAQVVANAAERFPARAPAVAAMGARLNAFDWSGIPTSLGHGDLTLENILLCPRRGAVFIDCDDGWISSYWLDIAKLYQDLGGHWCIRALYLDGGKGPALLNALQRLERIAAAIAPLIDPPLAARIPALAALHLFRTLPYARDDRLAGFVLARMSHVLAAATP